MPARAQNGAAAQQTSGRLRYAAHDARTRPLNHVEIDSPAIGFIADRKLGEDVRRRARTEQGFDDIAARLDQSTDPVGEIVGQALPLKTLRSHCQHPPFQFHSGGVQTVIHGRQREAEKCGDVLVRALMDKE
jgi:hypothetical protein